MPVAPGTRLGPYEILAKVGAGGMGEVYRARDTRLDRTVAVKVLPADRLDDAQARQRFDREARTVAALNHPHICQLHDVGHQDGVDYLVMEFHEGETLAERLSRAGRGKPTGLQIEEVLRHAVQIAEALSEAHRHGIVHRDLKPGNIVLTPSGVKLLDFGLAKLQPGLGAGPPLATLAATRENPLSSEGSILGTWPYMAPEQVEGRPADARTDIFAFGSVLYEMATGRRAFEGESHASLIAAILQRDPEPLSGQQPLAPAALERVVRKCLAKRPDARWQSASDLADALRWIDDERKASSGTAAAPATERPRWRGAWPWAAAVVAATAAYAGWQAARTAETTPVPVVRRFVLTPPADKPLSGWRFALSPDGTRLVYAGQGPQGQQLFSRRFDSFDVEPIAGTEGAGWPFFSFDGQSIGFHIGRRILRIPASGGTPRLVADTPGPGTHGSFWTRDDQILFSQVSVPTSRVPAGGGSTAVVVPIDEANHEIDQHGVTQLPSGAVLYGSHTGSNVFHVAALTPEGERRILIRNAFTPKYLPTGQLVFARGQSLRVVDFDPDRLAVGGTEATVVEGVWTFPESGLAAYTVSSSGTLAYVPAPSRGGRTLMWVDRSGRIEPVGTPAREYAFPSLSPDGTTLAVQVTDDGRDHIWLHRIGDGSSTRLVLEGSNSRPQFTPDGRAIVVASERGEDRLLVRQSVDTGTPEQILARSINTTFWPGWWTPDGATLLFVENPPTDVSLIRRLQIASGAIETLPLGPGTQRGPALSPDGRWLAYATEQSGPMEVYVRAVSGDGVARQITTEGGAQPRWSRDGREIFFLDGPRTRMMAVPVSLAPTLQIGPPRVLFTLPFVTPGALGPPPWDVTPDGRRFVMVKASDEELQPSVVAIVEGWFEELKRVRGAR
jgi:serine/threonine-protein kinase